MALAQMEQFSVTKIVKFDAAHRLPGYPGDCAELHGHTWKVEVEVRLAKEQIYDPDKDQMLIDFRQFKDILKAGFLTRLDHSYLNMLGDFEYPSAENITLWITRELRGAFPDNVELCRVRVWESEDAYAEWRRI
jgi:6-pyruvoyltetrahydropterin/6-carboxytetrahydropterin synthase